MYVKRAQESGAKLTTGVFLTFVLLLTSACGGGGGSSSATPATPVTTVSITPLTLTVTADASVSSAPVGQIYLTLTNVPDAGVYVGNQSTHNGIATIALQQTSSTTGLLNVSFADPSVIGPGTYTDSVEVAVCLDNLCNSPVSGSPKTINVTYTVTGTLPPLPSMTLSSTTLDVIAQPFGAAPDTTVGVTFQNAPNPYMGASTAFTSNGIGNVYFSNTDSTHGQILIYFKPPNALAFGVYTDTITVQANCYNGCPRGISGGDQVITVQYTVSNTVPGANGYTIKLLESGASDIAWNQSQQKLYFTARSSTPTYGNSVTIVDPLGGTIGQSYFVGSEPSIMAISDNNQYLYVGLQGSNSVRRMQLPSLTQDILIPLGSDPLAGGLTAGDIQVAPGLPNTIAVARVGGSNISGAAYGLVVYDNAVPRTNIVGIPGVPPAINSVQWAANASILYGNTSENTSFSVSTMSVDANGVQVVSTHGGVGTAFNFGRLHYAGAILYSDGGQAFDPSSNLTIGTFIPIENYWSRATLPDPVHGKLFMLSNGNGLKLTSYNLDTFTPIASISLNGLDVQTYGYTKLIRWGTDGLAFITNDGKIALINGAFVD